MVASHTLATRDLACNPGMCPDLELNRWPSGSQAGAQSTEPDHPGHALVISIERHYVVEMDNILKHDFKSFVSSLGAT